MASDIVMMLLLSAAAAITVALVARIPDAPGHYTDPTWIVATMLAVMMVQGFYVATWLCRMFQALERLLLILTGVESGAAQFLACKGASRPLWATLRRLIEEVACE